jgi:hypothetical protein
MFWLYTVARGIPLYGDACKTRSGHAGENPVGIGGPALKLTTSLELSPRANRGHERQTGDTAGAPRRSQIAELRVHGTFVGCARPDVSGWVY